MTLRQLRVLYREFLFRLVDLEVLSSYAQGDSNRLLGQFASLLIVASILFSLPAMGFGGSEQGPLVQMVGAWIYENFLISTTMLVVGLFAVLSWDSTFPNRRDVMVLAPLPVRGRTLFLAKIAAVATALGITVAALHLVTGVLWPFAFARMRAAPAPALTFQPALPPAHGPELRAILERDLAGALRHGPMAEGTGTGVVIGITDHGERQIFTYGIAKPDSLFEIGSISKTFTATLLAVMAGQGEVGFQEPVRLLLPTGTVRRPVGHEITLVDLATHRSGLPRMPDNVDPADTSNPFLDYDALKLYESIRKLGVAKDPKPPFVYSNFGFGLLGVALAERARTGWPNLIQHTVLAPLGMRDTAVTLTPEQQARFLPGQDVLHRVVHPWDMDALSPAGGLRSGAADMLTYLEAQLHPERIGGTLGQAIRDTQAARTEAGGGLRIGLAWFYDPQTGAYYHSGGTGGFTTHAFFHRKGEYAGIVLFNMRPSAIPFAQILGDHVRQRMAGLPAYSLDYIEVTPVGGFTGVVRSFAAYWLTMLASGAFTFCCVLLLQGIASQALPRGWFLRVSGLLQIGAFILFVCGYFMLRSPGYALVVADREPWLAWVPAYWFVALFQQLHGSLHPALAPMAQRAWLGLAAVLGGTAVVYLLSYLRTMRKIVEQPEIAPGSRSTWLPRFGGPLETAIVRFSIRTLLRSRQHRVILAFFLGLGFACTVLLIKTPMAQDIAAASPDDPWTRAGVPLLASTFAMMAFAVVGMRIVFAMPLEPRSNWIFRAMALQGGPALVRARRRALLVLGMWPMLLLWAIVLFSLWPWREAALHLAVLGLSGSILAELCLRGTQKIPFTCAYLPGKANVHVTFWMCITLFYALVVEFAEMERRALHHPAFSALMIGTLALIWLALRWWSSTQSEGGPEFEEIPADAIQQLGL